MPTKNFNCPVVNLKGESEMQNGEILTFVICVTNALLASYPDEMSLLGEEKFKRFQLAKKIHGSGDIELTSEECVLLKKVVGKAYGAYVVGQIYEYIDA